MSILPVQNGVRATISTKVTVQLLSVLPIALGFLNSFFHTTLCKRGICYDSCVSLSRP